VTQSQVRLRAFLAIVFLIVGIAMLVFFGQAIFSQGSHQTRSKPAPAFGTQET
jgi:hypothetical protein